MKIKYEYVTGETVEIEVQDNIAKVAIEMDRDIRNSNRRETGKHNSVEELADKGTQLSDDRVDIPSFIERQEMRQALHKALDNLLPQQRELIQKIYFEGRTMADISREEDVTVNAIQNRLNKIREKLRKVLVDSQVG